MPSAGQVLNAVIEHRDPFVTADEISDMVDCTRREALSILTTLSDVDKLDTKKVGARARIFWHPDRVPSKEPLTEPSRESTTEPSQAIGGQIQETESDGQIPSKEPSREPSREPSAVPLSVESVDGVFDRISRAEWEDAFHHRGYTEERIEAVKLTYEYIREEGEGQRADLHEKIFAESNADFSDSEELWDKVIAKGLGLVAEYDTCLLRPSGGRRWWAYSPVEAEGSD